MEGLFRGLEGDLLPGFLRLVFKNQSILFYRSMLKSLIGQDLLTRGPGISGISSRPELGIRVFLKAQSITGTWVPG